MSRRLRSHYTSRATAESHRRRMRRRMRRLNLATAEALGVIALDSVGLSYWEWMGVWMMGEIE